MRLIITGLSGYIGQSLHKTALDAGHTVVSMGRTAPTLPVEKHYSLQLGEPVNTSILHAGDIFIHLAASANTMAEPDKEKATLESIITACSEKGARLIFISSIMAACPYPTTYAVTKKELESRTLESGGQVIRPGLVYGGTQAGLFKMLLTCVKKLPLLPAFLPAPTVQPVHVDDLSAAILSLAEKDLPPGTAYNVASQKPISFHAFLSALNCVCVQKPRLFVPVPRILFEPFLKVMAKAGLAPKYLSERIFGLLNNPTLHTSENLIKLGIKLRPFPASLLEEKQRSKAITREAIAQFRYVLGVKPTATELRLYHVYVREHHHNSPFFIPALALRFPFLLAAYDKSLRDSLFAIITISEYSNTHRSLLSMESSHGKIRCLIILCTATLVELRNRVIALVLSPASKLWRRSCHG